MPRDHILAARVATLEEAADMAEEYRSWDLAYALRERARQLRVGVDTWRAQSIRLLHNVKVHDQYL